MVAELPKQYDPSTCEAAVYSRWMKSRSFAAFPRRGTRPYVIMMPLPNVTGALHMGHAMDGVMQDLLTRWHRMRGENALWLPGVDHAGIATQAVVEKRLLELEGKTRHDLGRERLVERIFSWSRRYRERIVRQQQAMGCSCDWDRQRYTMDSVCKRAVLWTFFRMFRDGLIYRGDRMINWDCLLQTAVSDDEIVRETVDGSFWHLRYPVADPGPGEPDHVVVATTRPETMLGDTAVACHPDPDGALEARLREARQKCRQASPRDRPDLEAEVRRLEARRRSHLPTLRRLVEMARQGRSVRLPLLDRPLPLILDEWAKPELGSGCVKITPAHDPNDYQVWLRHQEAFGIVNILNPDGTLNASAGAYQGLDRFAAREKVLQDLEKRGLVEAIEQRSMDVALSDRSKTVIEPYVSRQWFVRMGDVEGGITCGGGTPKAFTAPGLAQAALDAVREEWSSASGLRLSFHPDPQRYRNTYVSWLSEKRDWCISRQLWWGHRIPVWSASLDSLSAAALAALETILDREDVCVRLSSADGGSQRLAPADLRGGRPGPAGESAEVQVALRDPDAPARDSGSLAEQLEEAGFQRDPDVLDTWFSSGLWPHSTLGWPEPESAPVEPGQSPLGEREGEPDCLSFYYPGSCLVTGRDIITLWIVRMVVMGLYNLGDLPFKDVFIHATILDGKGERMSKSKGNGIDPEDIIERYGCDAMRYVLSEMQTGTQDVRLPVQAISPYTGKAVDLAAASHGKSIFTYLCPETGKEFDVLGTMPDLPAAKLISERFEVGRNFCNKLWNASRFALMNLDQAGFQPCSPARLLPEDRWILSRLAQVIARVNDRLEAYNPAAALAAAREFFWGELCDWYLEMIKGRLRNGPGGPQARQVLAVAVDQVLRLLHPFVPFITEVLWGHLNRQVPRRGIEAALEAPDQLIQAPWPRSPSHWIDRSLEEGFRSLREIIHAIRDLRSRFNVPPRRALEAHLRATGAVAAFLETSRRLLMELAGLDALSITGEARRTPDTAAAVVGEVEVLIRGVVDPVRERARLTGQRERLARDLASLRRKLANAGFLSKAPADVVERQRARAADLEGRIEAIDAHLETLA